MLQSYTILEILLGLAVFVIAASELQGVLTARREGRSRNVSRVVTHAVMIALLVPYVYFAYSYLPLETAGRGIETFGTPTFNWTYLIIGLMLAFLAAWEALALLRARRQGLTRNSTRLVSHTVMFLVLLVMMGLSVRKWDRYLDRLEATYAKSIPAEYASSR